MIPDNILSRFTERPGRFSVGQEFAFLWKNSREYWVCRIIDEACHYELIECSGNWSVEEIQKNGRKYPIREDMMSFGHLFVEPILLQEVRKACAS